VRTYVIAKYCVDFSLPFISLIQLCCTLPRHNVVPNVQWQLLGKIVSVEIQEFTNQVAGVLNTLKSCRGVCVCVCVCVFVYILQLMHIFCHLQNLLPCSFFENAKFSW